MGNFARTEDNANPDKEVSAIYCSNSKLFVHCKKIVLKVVLEIMLEVHCKKIVLKQKLNCYKKFQLK